MKTGIDLGTTYSLIAKIDREDCPILVPDSHYRNVIFTPSVVNLGAESAFVGHMAELIAEDNPNLAVQRFFKRNMGNTSPLAFDSGNNPWYAESISALVLKKLAFDAEAFSNEKITGTVITIPAHFNDAQRKATITAAHLANIPLLGIVEEPVAAAIHYGFDTHSKNKIIMVYDLGGGTFDATVLSMDARGIYVLAKDGLTEVGGKEFDEAISALILEQLNRSNSSSLNNSPLNGHALMQLKRLSEEIKIELCMPGKNYIKKPIILGKHGLEVMITRPQFFQSIHKYLEEAEDVCFRCLKSSGLSVKDVDLFLLVGGSSMVPVIQERMKKIFCYSHQQVLFHEPSRAVAFGALLHAHQLVGDSDKFNIPPELKGVTGHNIGIQIFDGLTGRVKIDVLIKKNLPLPIRNTKVYYTSREQQNRIALDVVQYLDDPSKALIIGQLIIGPLPPLSIGHPIQVTIEAKADGTISLYATDPRSGNDIQKSFNNNKSETGYLNLQKALVQSTFINNIQL